MMRKDLVPQSSGQLTTLVDPESLPPILHGSESPRTVAKIEKFYLSVAEMFERWVERHESKHTQRAYRQGVMSFIKFLGMDWPKDGTFLYTVSVGDVQAFRDMLVDNDYAPKTIVHRISAVSGFYKYLREAAIEMRLPINVPNPAHSQFISRETADPVEETKALSLALAQRLRTMPTGEGVLDYRDRAIIDFYLYSGCRIATGCLLTVRDFLWEEDDPKIRINEKGKKRRTIGIHHQGAETIRDYIAKAGFTNGPLFRPRLNPRSKKLAERQIAPCTMYFLLQSYLERLPGSMVDREEHDPLREKTPKKCKYTPHSLRATTATLLLNAGKDITAVQELLGHRHVTTTQIYDKRRRASRDSASHDVPI